jgi:hypothetical protein
MSGFIALLILFSVLGCVLQVRIVFLITIVVVFVNALVLFYSKGVQVGGLHPEIGFVMQSVIHVSFMWASAGVTGILDRLEKNKEN